MLKIKLVFLFMNIFKFTSGIPPNIVIIMADDLGRGDVSFNNNNEFIVTPNIDALGYNGIILNKFHAHSMCTASRGALMTGKYSIHTGLQHDVIANDEPWGMSPNEKTLPEYLGEVGYDTYLIGKWHLGMSKKMYNPIRRGFHSFYGYLGAYITYQNHDLCMINHIFWPPGHDMRNNEDTDTSTKGQHATDLFTSKAREVITNHDKTKPLFLMVSHLAAHSQNYFDPHPDSEEAKQYWYITNIVQQRLAGQITKLDNSVGKIVQALDEKGILQNTVIIFLSDNGAPTSGCLYTAGSNYPLKGQKHTPWEGATHVPAIVYSPLLNNRQYVSNTRLHITDIFTTIIGLSGAKLNGNPIDGKDAWDNLSNKRGTEIRDSIVHNIDDYVSYTKGDWKYVKDTTDAGIYDYWLGDTLQNDCVFNTHKNSYRDSVRNSDTAKALKKYSLTGNDISDADVNNTITQTKIYCTKCANICTPWLCPCLFNIKNDPCERENLAASYPLKVLELEADILLLRFTITAKRNAPSTDDANPAWQNNQWNWWEGDQ